MHDACAAMCRVPDTVGASEDKPQLLIQTQSKDGPSPADESTCHANLRRPHRCRRARGPVLNAYTNTLARVDTHARISTQCACHLCVCANAEPGYTHTHKHTIYTTYNPPNTPISTFPKLSENKLATIESVLSEYIPNLVKASGWLVYRLVGGVGIASKPAQLRGACGAAQEAAWGAV